MPIRWALTRITVLGVFLLAAPARLEARDCNLNELEDALEIATGAASDCNGNGIPDACDLAPRLAFDAGRAFDGSQASGIPFPLQSEVAPRLHVP